MCRHRLLCGGQLDSNVEWDSSDHGVPLGRQPSGEQRVADRWGDVSVRFNRRGFSLRCPGVDGPALPAFLGPVPAEVLDGLVDVVGDDPHR